MAMGRPADKKVDWQKIERLYRAGLLPIAEISRECKTGEANIRRVAKKNGWKRDLTQEVRNLTRTKMVENLSRVFQDGEERLKAMGDEQIVEEASRTQVEVVRQHQASLKQGHSLTLRMLDELDTATSRRGELEGMITSTVAPQRQEALRRALSLGARATVMKDLANAAKTWVSLERQAFNIIDDRDDKDKDRKLDDMTAEQLRSEILKDAKQIGLDLSDTIDEDLAQGVSGKVH